MKRITQNKIESLRSLSFLYSTATVRNIIKDNSLCAIQDRIKKHQIIFKNAKNNLKFSYLLTELHAQMSENYCNEYLYKSAILNQYLIEKYGLEDTILIDEFKIGKSVADVILLNGEIKIFEVKTDLDSLKRLDSQLLDYQKIANKVYIVTNRKYIKEIFERYYNTSYGIIEFENNLLIEQKEAVSKIDFLSHEEMFKAIRKDEYLNIINRYFGFIPNVSNTKIFRECLELSKQISTIEFQKMVISELKNRKIKSPDYLLNEKTPKELRFICHSLNLDKTQYQTLYKLLDTTL